MQCLIEDGLVHAVSVELLGESPTFGGLTDQDMLALGDPHEH